MNAHALTQADYLDILYDNRNKKYGSYELRKHYSNRMRKALLMVVAAAAALSVYSFMKPVSNKHVDNTVVNTPNTVCTLNIETHKIELPKPKAAPAVKPTVANVVPKIVDDAKVTEPPKTVTDIATKDPGLTNTTGDPNSTSNIKTDIIGGASTTAVEPPVTAPITWAEVMPEFNGDMNAFLQKQLRYPDAAREASVEGKVVVQFVVNEDGSVSNTRVIKSIGAGCDEEAVRVVRSMPKWKPGKQNGKAVKVIYSLPIRFVLQ